MNQNSSETVINDQSPRSITLTMRQGPSQGQRFVVNKDTITIGRLPDNDIAIQDQQVSRNHATIAWEGNQFVIHDLGSANGTTVNGTRLTGPCPLRDGDVIGLGDIILTFKGSTGMTSYGETYIRPGPSPSGAASGPVQASTIPMPPQVRPSSNIGLLVGVGLAAIFGLVVVAGLLFFFVFQSQAGPKVSVQQPLSGSQVQAGQPLTILASVQDPKGISRVEFWVNNALEAMIPGGPPGGQKELFVQQAWTPQSGGPHTLSLRAFNVDGKMSEPFNITINVIGAGPAGTPTPIVQATATSPQAAATTALASPPCANNSAFVADVTVPDNSVFPPGAKIDKIWRIQNNGSCPWQTGYQLKFVSGDKMGAPDSQAVVPTAPGGTTDVTVTMYAPPAPGIYKGVWRMVSNTGQAFGQSLTVLIQVPSPNTATPTITPTWPAPPPPPGPIVQLTADSLMVNAGNCTMVRALVQNVAAAWLDGEPIVGGYKEKQVCPCTNTTYNLEAVTTGGQHVPRSVTVNVIGVCAASKPDLVVKELEADNTTVLKGNPINLKARIKNEGATQAVNLAVAWRPLGATWIIVADTINLAPGEDKWINWSYTYSEAGTYDSRVTVDYLNNVNESNEGNNSKDLTIQVNAFLIPPGVLTGIAPGPMVTIDPGILATLLAATPSPEFQMIPGFLNTPSFQINPGLILTAVSGP